MTSASPASRATSRLTALGSRLSRDRRQRAAVYAAALVGVAAAALAFGLWGIDQPQSQTGGVLDPIVVTRWTTVWGLPIARLAVDVSLVGTIGMLVTCVLLPREDGELSDVARRCLHGVTGLALAWAVATAAMLALLWTEFSRQPVTEVSVQSVFTSVSALPDAVQYLFVSVLALLIAAAAQVMRSRLGALLVLLLAVYNVVPLTTLAREEQGSLVGIAVTVHIVALSLWLGGLAGILIHVRRSPELLAVVLPRFNVLALGCFVVVGATGLTAAWMNLGSLPELLDSHYGMLVMYLAEALVALGVFGWWHRRRTVSGAAAEHSPAFARYAAIEVAVVVATIALGVALSRTPAPAAEDPLPVFHGQQY